VLYRRGRTAIPENELAAPAERFPLARPGLAFRCGAAMRCSSSSTGAPRRSAPMTRRRARWLRSQGEIGGRSSGGDAASRSGIRARQTLASERIRLLARSGLAVSRTLQPSAAYQSRTARCRRRDRTGHRAHRQSRSRRRVNDATGHRRPATYSDDGKKHCVPRRSRATPATLHYMSIPAAPFMPRQEEVFPDREHSVASL